MGGSRLSLEMTLAILVIKHQLEQRFQQLTGMSLDEWDELNYRRVMAGG